MDIHLWLEGAICGGTLILTGIAIIDIWSRRKK
jgi:hypothetical protein